jgi:O-antigen ligase
VYPRFATVDDGRYANQAHNDWLQCWAEAGIPGFLALSAFALLVVRPSFASVWGIGIVAVLLHGLVDYPLQKPVLTAWMSVLAAAVSVAEEDR